MALSKRAVIVGCAAVAAVVVGVNVAKVVAREPDHPSAWDPRVADLVGFVERERGLDFEHPVEVRFLPEAEFREEVTSDEADLSDEDDAEFTRQEAAARAFGLLGPDDDLFEQVNTVTGEGILAYYSPEDTEIVVRGDELDVAMQGTLVHELVHALQDQTFDLAELQEKAVDSAADLAITGLIEGDATTVEHAWVDALDEDEREDYDDRLEAVTDDVESGTEDVSPAITAVFGAPYELGPGFVDVLRAEGGRARLDEAFASPPLSDAHLLRPDRFLAGDQPQQLDPPSLPTASAESEPDALGALGLYLALVSEIDPVQALEAADGWDGDVFVAYEENGQGCARLDVVGTDAAATDRIETAFEAWAGDRDGFEEVQRIGDIVAVKACDPGRQAVQASDDEVALPFVRAAVLGEFVSQGMPVPVATCAANDVTSNVELEVLLADELDDDQLTTLQDDVGELVSACAESAD